MVKIRFKQTVISSTFGTLTEGTILSCGDAHAAHFVDELRVADRVLPAAAVAPAVEADQAMPAEATKARKRGGAAK
jgi:hypothetical protein